MKQKLFTKDFTMVVIGQIISLFGNAIIRFVLPLYLLNLTGSSALYGTVMACAFVPAVMLSPVGGIAADRVNKRNVMVILDFFTAAFFFIFISSPCGLSGKRIPIWSKQELRKKIWQKVFSLREFSPSYCLFSF